jgi:hypothetical protein
LFGTPFGIKITPPVKHYIILSNKWGAVQNSGSFFIQKAPAEDDSAGAGF